MATSYSIQVFDAKDWDMLFDATAFNTQPKKCMPLKLWAEQNKADISSNLCYFNFASSKEYPCYTVQYLRIPRLGGDCGYGSYSTNDLITLPNGDRVSGWTNRKDKLPIIKNDVVYKPTIQNTRSHNMIGLTKSGKIIIAKATRGTTEYTMAVRVQRFVQVYYKDGIKLLFCEDGGGSTGLYSARTKVLFAPEQEGVNGRSVCSVFCATYKGNLKTNKTLKKGGYGEDVRLLQMLLGGLECDGIYGNATVQAVKTAQKSLKLTVDGIAGKNTLTALGLWQNS